MAVGSITTGGLMSGMDTESIISQLMQLERRPVTLLQQRETNHIAEISAFGTLKSALSGLHSEAQALKEESNLRSYGVTSSNRDTLSASVSGEATPGTYRVEVTQLAQAQQVRSAAFSSGDDTVGTGTLTLEVGDASTDIAIDAESNTLSGIAAAINDADAGVTAYMIDDGAGNAYLTLLSQETGSDNTITLTMADDDGVNDDASGLSSLYTDPATQDLTETQEARNAQLTVNGIVVERASNTVEDAVEGLTLTLNEADPGNPVTVDVAENANSAVKGIQDFVTAYNSVVDTFEGLQSYDSESEEAGLLLGDRTTTMLRSRLRRFLSEQVDGVASEVNGLSRLGINVDRDGKLAVDQEALTEALEEHRDDVLAFFTQDDEGKQGFAVQLYETLDAYVKTGGIIEAKTDGLQDSVDDIEDQIAGMEVRFEQREENLRNQFESLEVLLAEYQTTENMLTQQLASLDNLNNYISSK